jgi:septal ring factor EnvC (AmiA/AmiB activator)
MKILHNSFKQYGRKQLKILRFPAIVICFSLTAVFSGPFTETCCGFVKEPGPPIQLGSNIPVKIKIEQQDRTEQNNQISKQQKSAPQNITQVEQQHIVERNIRLRRLQEGIIDQKIKILGSQKKERTLLGEIEKIDQELQTQKNMLATLKTKSEKQELLLTNKQEYLRQVLTEKRKHQAIVKKRLAAYYRMGSVGFMNVVFSSKSLPELLKFNENFKLMIQHDHEIIQQYLNELKESNKAREEHAREKLHLMQLTDEVKEKENELTRVKQEKNLLLKKVNTEQQLYEQAVAEIEEAVADLAATLKQVEIVAETQGGAVQENPDQSNSKTAATKNKPPEKPNSVPEGFPGQKGVLDPPVEGVVISLYGQRIKGRFDTFTVTNGIDIKVKKGVEIKAVYDGKIIHSGYLRGYGNLMIIDHGDQYFSLISRAAEFYLKEGSHVLTGEVIGITGEGDPLYGEGLHFEIRKGSNPEDPLLWIKKDALKIETPNPTSMNHSE